MNNIPNNTPNNKIKISIPQDVELILSTLESNNFSAYIVGGCVRDTLLDIEPKDYDITTNATPQQIINIFKDYRVIETGLAHGTVTVIINNIPYEVTTFRIDGVYLDNRHPSEVIFTDDLTLDLSRRDFTINAMAYNHTKGLIDPFDGFWDLHSDIIRCVGNPDDRFKEDALRMMRAIRFACRLNFAIDIFTTISIVVNSDLIKNISNERIQSELNQILMNTNNDKQVYSGMDRMYMYELLNHILPELEICFDVEQNNPYHIYDVGTHIVESVKNIQPTLHLKLTMLLHDIAKPQCKTTDENGVDHFYGHNQIGSDMAREILRRLRYDNDTIEKVTTLILYHDSDIAITKPSIKRWLNKIGIDLFRDLLKVKHADTMAHNPDYYYKRHNHLMLINILLTSILNEQDCFTKKDLAITGDDLIKLGFKQGKTIGNLLDRCMGYVIDNPEKNNKDDLIEFVKNYL